MCFGRNKKQQERYNIPAAPVAVVIPAQPCDGPIHLTNNPFAYDAAKESYQQAAATPYYTHNQNTFFSGGGAYQASSQYTSTSNQNATIHARQTKCCNIL